MKREELTELGLSPETMERVLALYGRDVEKHKTAAAQWQQKHAQDTAALQAQLARHTYESAANAAAQSLRFTSESARKAFLTEVNAAALPLANGALEGFEAFVQAYRESDPAAFATPESPKAPVFVLPGTNPAQNPSEGALRAAFGL